MPAPLSIIDRPVIYNRKSVAGRWEIKTSKGMGVGYSRMPIIAKEFCLETIVLSLIKYNFAGGKPSTCML